MRTHRPSRRAAHSTLRTACLTAATAVCALALGACGGSGHAAAPATSSTITVTPATPTPTTASASQDPASSGAKRARAKHAARPSARVVPGSGVIYGKGANASAIPPPGTHVSSAVGYRRGTPFHVTTVAMEPSFVPSSKIGFDASDTTPQVGDVIVFHLPQNAVAQTCVGNVPARSSCPRASSQLTNYVNIDRVVGLPGDTIAIRGGVPIRNGQPETGVPTIACGSKGSGCDLPAALKVPANTYFLLSDNRGFLGQDSRVWGPLPKAAIIGVVAGAKR